MGEFVNRYKIHIIIFSLATIIFCLPIFKDIHNWGINDWDQALFWNELPRKSILKYHQFPFWNPYANGGNVHLAHPHSAFLNPFFIIVLFFGTVVGAKINIFIYFFIGLLGFFYLLRYLKITLIASYFGSFIFMFNAYLSLQLAGGPWYLTIAYIPWIFLFYYKALREDKRWIVGSIFALSLMSLAGSVDVFAATVFLILLYSFLESVRHRTFRHFSMGLLLILGTFFLCAIKTLPLLDFIRDYPRFIDDPQGVRLNFKILYHMFLDRHQSELFLMSFKNTVVGLDPEYQKAMNLSSSWQSYGFYIGIIPLIFFIVGIVINIIKKRLHLVVSCMILFFIILGSKAPVNIWRLLHMCPIYNFLRSDSGFASGFLFCLSIISSFAFMEMQNHLRSFNRKVINFILCLILLFIFIDLRTVNLPILAEAFKVPPLKIEENDNFHLVRDFVGFDDRPTRSAMLAAILANRGIINSYEVLQVRQGELVHQPYRESELITDWLFLDSFCIESNSIRAKDKDKDIITDFEVLKNRENCWNRLLPELGINASYLFFDLGQQYLSSKSGYLLTYIYSPFYRRARFRMARDAGVSIYSNGILIYKEGYNKVKFYDEVVECELKKGWNKIIIYTFRNSLEEKWRLILGRFTDRYSFPYKDLVYHTSKKIIIPNYEEVNEIYLLNNNGSVKIREWSPNVIIADIFADEKDTVVLNQNYYKGWRVIGLGNSTVFPWKGLISVKVPPGKYRIKFYYIPPGFYLGFFITLVSSAIIFYYRKK